MSCLMGTAQTTNTTGAAANTRSGQVVVTEKLTTTDATTVGNLRPSRPEREPLPTEVVTRIQRFKENARLYLERQQALKKQLLGANDLERARIRAQMELYRQQWLREARQFRTDAQDRVIELQNKMPSRREVLDGLNDSARDQLRETLSEQQRTVRDR